MISKWLQATNPLAEGFDRYWRFSIMADRPEFKPSDRPTAPASAIDDFLQDRASFLKLLAKDPHKADLPKLELTGRAVGTEDKGAPAGADGNPRWQRDITDSASGKWEAIFKQNPVGNANAELEKIKGPDKVQWEKQADGTWKGTKPDGSTIDADRVSIRGQGGQTEIVIEEKGRTTTHRMDGSKVEERTSDSGGNVVVVKDSKDHIKSVIHNGLPFDVDDRGNVTCRDGKNRQDLKIDEKTGAISFKRGDVDVSLLPDGKTVAFGNNERIVAHPDKTRAYFKETAGGEEASRLRDDQGNYYTRQPDGSVLVTDRAGKKSDHPLNNLPAGVTVTDFNPDTRTIRTSDGQTFGMDGSHGVKGAAANERNVEFSDHHKVTSEQVGAVSRTKDVTDTKNRKWDVTYNAANPEQVDKVAGPPGEPTYQRGVGGVTDIRVDQKGVITVQKGDQTIIRYPDQTTVTKEAGKTTTEFADGHKVFSETKDGALQRNKVVDTAGNAWDIKYDDKDPTKIKEATGPGGSPKYINDGTTEVTGISVDENGKITVEKKDKSSISHNPDRSTETQALAGDHTVKVKKEVDGAGKTGPVEIDDGKNKFKVVYNPAASRDADNNIDAITDEKGNVLYKKDANTKITARDNGTIKIENSATGETIVLNPTDQTKTTTKGDSTTTEFPDNHKVVQDKNKIEVYDTEGKKAWEITRNDKGDALQVKDADGKPVFTRNEKGVVNITVDDKGVIKAEKDDKSALTLNPDRTTVTQFPDGHTETRDKQNLWLENGGNKFEYVTDKSGNPITDADGNYILSKVQFKDGTSLTRQPNGEYVFNDPAHPVKHGEEPHWRANCRLDDKGMLHMESPRGQHIVWDADGPRTVADGDRKPRPGEQFDRDDQQPDDGHHRRHHARRRFGERPEYQVAREWDEGNDHVKEFKDGTQVTSFGRPPNAIEVSVPAGRDRQGNPIYRTTSYDLDPNTGKPVRITCDNGLVWSDNGNGTWSSNFGETARAVVGRVTPDGHLPYRHFMADPNTGQFRWFNMTGHRDFTMPPMLAWQFEVQRGRDFKRRLA
jgi:hypothetical protein